MLVFGYMNEGRMTRLRLDIHEAGLYSDDKKVSLKEKKAFLSEVKRLMKESQPDKEEILAMVMTIGNVMGILGYQDEFQYIFDNSNMAFKEWIEMSFIKVKCYLEISSYDKNVFDIFTKCLSRISEQVYLYKEEDVNACEKLVDDYIENNKDDLLKLGKELLEKHSFASGRKPNDVLQMDEESCKSTFGFLPDTIMSWENDFIIQMQRTAILRDMLQKNCEPNCDELCFELDEKKIEEFKKEFGCKVEEDEPPIMFPIVKRFVYLSVGNSFVNEIKENYETFKIKPSKVFIDNDGYVKFDKFDIKSLGK